MTRRLIPSGKGLTFLEILLDETICEGEIVVSREIVRQAGGINKRLKTKQKYELILRIASRGAIEFEEIEPKQITENEWILGEDPKEQIEKFGWQTDCYVIGKYSGELRESGYFDAAVSGVLQETHVHEQETLVFLEQMIGRTEKYYHIDEDTRPILIYKGDPVCHNVLTVFAEQLGQALERAGEYVIYFDLEKEEVSAALRYVDQHFKAVIGVQSYMFSVKMRDEVHYLHEYIHGPKYNFVFDHPVWMKQHMLHQLQDFHILTHDDSYAKYIEKYYQCDAVLFPPAGMQRATVVELERVYDLSFVGTYGDYVEKLRWIHEQERPFRFLLNRYLLIMKKNPNISSEDAFTRALSYYQIDISEERFLELMYEARWVIYCVMYYYRERVMRTILDAGVRIDVFGDSWESCPLRSYPNLICHPNVTVEESLDIWRQSKLSLNVMSWHKGGFTERMAGIMLAEAVLVTDDTSYLDGRYDANDMVIFRLDQLEKLPEKIQELLRDENRRIEIAECGKRKTEQEHTWDRRAEQLLELLYER